MLKRLADEGVIRAGRGRIQVTDIAMLKNLRMNYRKE